LIINKLRVSGTLQRWQEGWLKDLASILFL
jgi:hypothetical protein